MTNFNDLARRVMGLRGPSRRIIDRLDMSGDCWLWKGATDSRGRGRVSLNGKPVLHHRAVWEILCGPIPSGALLCHHCDNPRCANPAHLYIGDSKTNARDMFERKRHWTQVDPQRAIEVGARRGSRNNWSRGDRNPNVKLTPEQVAEIRSSTGSSHPIAARFGVNPSTVQRIRRGDLWPAAALLARGEQS